MKIFQSKLTPRKAAIIIFAVALLVRIAGFKILVYGNEENWHFGDADAYRNLAQNIAQGKGFCITGFEAAAKLDWWPMPEHHWYVVGRTDEPTQFYEPIFPLLLAGLYKVFGERADYVYIAFQMLFGSWICVLIYKLAQQLGAKAGAMWAGLFACIYPSMVFYSIVLMTDMLFFLLLLYTVLQGFRYQEKRSLGNLIGLSILIAATTLTRSVAIVAVPIIALAILFQAGGLAGRLKHVVVFSLIVSCLFGLWMVRNYRTFQEFSLLPSKGAFNFWETMAGLPNLILERERANIRQLAQTPWDYARVQKLYPELKRVDLLFLPQDEAWADSEPQRARQLTQITLEFIRGNPLFSIKRYLKVSAKMYLPFTIDTKSRLLQISQGGAYILALALGVWGWIKCRRKHPLLDLMGISLILYGMIVPLYSISNSQRSRMPFDVMFLWLAAYGFQALYDKFNKRNATVA